MPMTEVNLSKACLGRNIPNSIIYSSEATNAMPHCFIRCYGHIAHAVLHFEFLGFLKLLHEEAGSDVHKT